MKFFKDIQKWIDKKVGIQSGGNNTPPPPQSPLRRKKITNSMHPDYPKATAKGNHKGAKDRPPLRMMPALGKLNTTTGDRLALREADAQTV